MAPDVAAHAVTPAAARPRILLADDHAIVAEGVASLLDEDFDLVGRVVDGEALVRATLELTPDVIVADITMPRLSGLDAIRRLRARDALPPTIILTMHADGHLVAEALEAGARGYVLKQAAGEELFTAIHEVLARRIYVTPAVRHALARHTAARHPVGRRAAALTARQREVLRLIAEGRTMKEVAALLGISTRTAESHKYQIMDGVGLRTTAELVRYAIQTGLLPLDAGRWTSER